MKTEMENPGAGAAATGALKERKRGEDAASLATVQAELAHKMLWANSFSRWPTFSSFIRETAEKDFDLAGQAFWSGLSKYWELMDRIDHFDAAMLIEDFQLCWTPTLLSPDCRQALARLPEGTFPIYRGQSAHLLRGNAWTTDPSVAAWFAKNGIRGSGCPDPVVLVAEVSRDDVALALEGRREAEVVPLTYFSDDQVRVLPLADFCAVYGVTGDRPAGWPKGCKGAPDLLPFEMEDVQP